MYNFFVHPSTLQKMDQVLKMRMSEGAAGYGIFIMLLELLRDSENYRQHYDPAVIAWAMHEPDIDRLKRVCQDYNLFQIDENQDLSCPWLTSTMAAHEERRQKLSAAGKKSAAVKAERKETSSTTLPPPSQGGCNVVGELGQQNINKEKLEKNKKTTSLHIGDLGGVNVFEKDFISRVGKEKAAAYDPACGEFESFNDRHHNVRPIMAAAVTYSLTRNQVLAIMAATYNGTIGCPEFVALLGAFRHCKDTQFKPTYPFEYFMSKIAEAHEV